MIGAALRRLESERYLRGLGRFAGDLSAPGMLHAAVLRSPHAHARLRSIDPTAALALPGVLAVLTARELPPRAVIPVRIGGPAEMAGYLQPALARDVVRYAGEPVALVVARDAATAADALERVGVDYAPLDACPTVTAALAARAPLLFPGAGTNLVAPLRQRVGDPDAALAAAAVVVGGRFAYPRQTGIPLEPRGLLAVPPSPTGGELHLLGATKCVHINRGLLANILDLPPGALRLTEVDVGGGFGVRGELYPEDILVPLAALRLGRPVRWVESRREHLSAINHARESEWDAELGLDAEGRMLGLRVTIRADIGAYVRTAGLVAMEFGSALFPGPYRIAHYACDLLSVVTNKTPAGTLRSPGRPEANFVRERLVDMAARRLAMDPGELRRRNTVRPEDMPWRPGTVSAGAPTVYDAGDFPRLLDEASARLGRARAAAPPPPAGSRRGAGLALYVEKTGLGPFETVSLAVRPDGAIVVDTGASSMGPGLETALAQILASALGIGAERFSVRRPDTAAVESGVGTYASRGTVMAGNAAALAAAKLVETARARAAARFGVAADAVRYGAGELMADGQGVSLAELAAGAALGASASFKVTTSTYAGAAAAALVDVDPETGAVGLVKLIVGADVGRAVNPRLVDDQLVGGAAFGVGNALLERVVYGADGELLTGTLMDYALPLITDVPPVETFFQEVPATTNPLGLRGLGESGNPGIPAAVANAVSDALGGAPLWALPLTPERVLAAARGPSAG